MSRWDYGGAFERHPVGEEPYVFKDGSTLQVHDIFNPLPEFMKQADLLFVDPPWNQGNMTSFYTKADEINTNEYNCFYKRLFECIKEINPRVCYVEVGKEYLPDFIIEMRKIYKYVTFYNSTYYHKKDCLCYVIRGSNKFKKPKLDNIDEEDIIEWVTENEDYKCIGDLCMGRGLVAMGAFRNGKKFVGTELNHKRLSVTIERVIEMGGEKA